MKNFNCFLCLDAFLRFVWEIKQMTAKTKITCKKLSVLALFLISGLSAKPLPLPDENILVGDFSQGLLDGWQTKSFKDHTRYSLVTLDGTTILKAESINSASGLFKEQHIDLQKTPFLNWRWRIDKRLPMVNEQDKSGDDYAARVYIIINGGLAFWQTQAVNYVWAGQSAKGKFWPNAYAGNHAMMLAIRSKEDQTGIWYTEKRNVLADLKQLIGQDIHDIDAIAIMTDTDNSHGNTTAYYGDIYFSPQ